MSRLMRSCRLSWVALSLAALPAAAQNPDLTFHTVPPCTVVDTRVAGGAFAANETRTYNVVGNGSFASQGGSATGCGVPGFSNGIAQVQASALAVTVISPTGTGYVAANAADKPMAGAVLAFSAGDILQNTSQVAVAQTSGVGDIKVLVAASSAHVVIRTVGYYSKPVQTVHVHPVPGNHTASGTALLNAMSGITNASATKRYVLKLEPGIYDVGSTELAMKPYVEIEGSGQQATVIQGSGSDPDRQTAVVQGATSSELRNLQVKSTGSQSQPSAIAILITDGADLRIVDVTAVSSGSQNAWAIRNYNARAMIERSTLKADGGSLATLGLSTKGPFARTGIKHSVIEVTATSGLSYGINANDGGTYSELRDVQVKVSAANGLAYGYHQDEHLFPTSQTVRMTNCTIDVSGGTGVLFDGPRLQIEQSQIRASDTGVETYGMTVIEHSEITGGSDTVLSLSSSGTLIGASRLEGGPVTGIAICAGVYDESFTFFAGPACP